MLVDIYSMLGQNFSPACYVNQERVNRVFLGANV